MSHWPDLLQQLQASPTPCTQAEQAAVPLLLCPLQHKAALQVAGPQAKSFLQGQLSCDLEQVGDGRWRLGAHCDHKGRMHSSLRALAPNSELVWLLLRADIADSASAALAKYIVFSKAEIGPASELLGLGIAGEQAPALAAELAPGLEGPGSCAPLAEGGGQLLQIAPQRFELWADETTLKAIIADSKSTLKYQGELVDTDYWKLLDIRAGIGEIQAGSTAQFIPQMLNFNELEGISYQKGCYTGQEIIARMQYRGNLKRHMLYLHSEAASQAPVPGQALYNGEKAQAVGHIVDAVISTKGVEALAVLADEYADQTVYTEVEGALAYRAQMLSYAIT